MDVYVTSTGLMATYGAGFTLTNIEGSAQSIGPGKNQKHRWVYNDKSSQCVAVISEQNSGKVAVMTKGCEGYCGMTAVGAMDGIYRKK